MTISLTDIELTHFLLAIILLLCSAHFFGYIFQTFKLPRVIGEISGGLVLGPSFLGYFFPSAYSWIFHAFAAEGKLISSIYWLGLIMLMFISGFEIQRSFNKEDKKIITAILLGGTLIPFITGWFVPNVYDISSLTGRIHHPLALRIIISIAIAVTSIPVISKIFIDLNIMKTRFAKIIIATATIEDIILWIALAVATGLVSSATISITTITQTVIVTILFLLFGLAVLPKLFTFLTNTRFNIVAQSSILGYTLLVGFALTALASLLRVNAIFGALIAGMAIGHHNDPKFKTVQKALKEFSLAFFIPIYFAVVGLKLDLIRHFDLLFFMGFLVFAVACKMLGTLLAARIIRQKWLTAFNLSIAMNARGGPGIVLATVAFDMGIINESFFSTLVLVAIFTSLIAGYWFRFVLNKKWKLLEE